MCSEIGEIVIINDIYYYMFIGVYYYDRLKTDLQKIDLRRIAKTWQQIYDR